MDNQAESLFDANMSSDLTELPEISELDMRSPHSPASVATAANTSGGHKTVKDYERHLKMLENNNFELKLRVHMLEERLHQQDSPEKTQQMVVNLKVQVGEMRQELSQKRQLLLAARQAIDTLERQRDEAARRFRLQRDDREALCRQLQKQHHQQAFQLDTHDHAVDLIPSPDNNKQQQQQQQELLAERDALKLRVQQLEPAEEQLSACRQLCDQLKTDMAVAANRAQHEYDAVCGERDAAARQLAETNAAQTELTQRNHQLLSELDECQNQLASDKLTTSKLRCQVSEMVATLQQAGDQLRRQTADASTAAAAARRREARLAEQLRRVHRQRCRLLDWLREHCEPTALAQQLLTACQQSHLPLRDTHTHTGRMLSEEIDKTIEADIHRQSGNTAVFGNSAQCAAAPHAATPDPFTPPPSDAQDTSCSSPLPAALHSSVSQPAAAAGTSINTDVQAAAVTDRDATLPSIPQGLANKCRVSFSVSQHCAELSVSALSCHLSSLSTGAADANTSLTTEHDINALLFSLAGLRRLVTSQLTSQVGQPVHDAFDQLNAQLTTSLRGWQLMRRRLRELASFLEKLLRLERAGQLDLSSCWTEGDRSQLHTSLALVGSQCVQQDNDVTIEQQRDSAKLSEIGSGGGLLDRSSAGVTERLSLPADEAVVCDVAATAEEEATQGPRVSPQQLSKPNEDGRAACESDDWSEPDRSVSLARMGLLSGEEHQETAAAGRASSDSSSVSDGAHRQFASRRRAALSELASLEARVRQLRQQKCRLTEQLDSPRDQHNIEPALASKFESESTNVQRVLTRGRDHDSRRRSQTVDVGEILAGRVSPPGATYSDSQRLQLLQCGSRFEQLQNSCRLASRRRLLRSAASCGHALLSADEQVAISNNTDSKNDNVDENNNADIADYRLKCAQQKADIAHFSQQQQLLQKQVDSLKQQLLTEQERHQCDMQLQRQQAEDELKQQLQQTADTRARAEQQLSQASAEQQRLARQLTRLHDKHQLLTAEHRRVSEQLGAAELRSRQLVDQLTAERDRLTQLVGQLEERTGDCVQSNERLTQQLSELRVDNAQLAQQVAQLKTAVDCVSVRSVKAEQALADAETRSARLQAELTAADENQQLTQLETAQLRGHVHQLQLSNQQLSEQLTARLAEVTRDEAIARRSVGNDSVLLSGRVDGASGPANSVHAVDAELSCGEVSHIACSSGARMAGTKLTAAQTSIDSDVTPTYSSPDLGIESDMHRWPNDDQSHSPPSSPPSQPPTTAAHTQPTEDKPDGGSEAITTQLRAERDQLQQLLADTRRQLLEAQRQLNRADKRKTRVEGAIYRQLSKTHDVLQRAKLNLSPRDGAVGESGAPPSQTRHHKRTATDNTPE